MVTQLGADQLRERLHRLKLDGMADNLDALGEQAAKEEWTYATFLGSLLDEELAAREQRRLSVSTKMARFSFHNTREQFDFAFQPSVEKRRIQELASLRFVAGGSNVLFLGLPGVGKTHLAIGLGLQALQAGLSTYFVSVPDLMDQVSHDAQRGQLPKRMQQLQTQGLSHSQPSRKGGEFILIYIVSFRFFFCLSSGEISVGDFGEISIVIDTKSHGRIDKAVRIVLHREPGFLPVSEAETKLEHEMTSWPFGVFVQNRWFHTILPPQPGGHSDDKRVVIPCQGTRSFCPSTLE